MKLSLTWLFEHIEARLQDYDLNQLLEKFVTTTAEVDSYRQVIYPLDALALGCVQEKKQDQILLNIPEWKKEVVVPNRDDLALNSWCVVKKEKRVFSYGLFRDLGGDLDALLPAVYCSSQEEKKPGFWRTHCVTEDYVITIDNKSLTNRPDLWGHRGIARELAALLGVNLLPEERLLSSRIIKNYPRSSPVLPHNPIALSIETPELCSRVAGLYVSKITRAGSVMGMMQKLLTIGARPHEAIVDATNYVMFDIGQPLHAFDAAIFAQSKKLVVTNAQKEQKLTLLDGKTITLTDQDCVITDGNNVRSLAGIMGGKESGVSSETTALLVESGNFNANTIRASSARYKLRSEASVRFEKGLDPNQNTIALMRFLQVLDEYAIPHTASSEIISIGVPAHERVILCSHDMITQKIGMMIAPEKIITILTALGFGVQESQTCIQASMHTSTTVQDTLTQSIEYTVTVPTFRLHDVTIPVDIVDEIARFIGYDSIPQVAPARPIKPVNYRALLQLRALKRHSAFGLGMNEVVNYPLYDEEFLRLFSWQPDNAPELANPVSEHWRRLVTSRIPGLLKTVMTNLPASNPLRFFEWGKVWYEKNKSIIEQLRYAAIWYNTRETEYDFYVAKAALSSFFEVIGIPVVWQKAEVMPGPWYHPYQTAVLTVNSTVLGYAGILSPVFLQNKIDGSGFITELDGELLLSFVKEPTILETLPKYPHSELDISVLVPLSLTVAQLEEAIALADGRIRDIYLIDYYTNPSWPDKRSVTIRYVVSDESRTLTKQDLDEVSDAVVQNIVKLGATIR